MVSTLNCASDILFDIETFQLSKVNFKIKSVSSGLYLKDNWSSQFFDAYGSDYTFPLLARDGYAIEKQHGPRLSANSTHVFIEYNQDSSRATWYFLKDSNR